MDNNQYPPLEEMIAQFMEQQNNTNAAPAPQNVTLKIKDQTYQFASPEDASNVVNETVTQYETQLAAARQRLAELEQIQATRSAQPQSQPGADKPRMDPEEWARMAINDPTKATEEAFKKTELYQQMMQQLQASQVNQIAQDFFTRHPAYRNPQFAEKLEGVRRELGLGMSPQHLEAVLSHAQLNGVVPMEKELMQQRQQAPIPQMQQQHLPFAEFQNQQPNYPPPTPQNYPPPVGAPPQIRPGGGTAPGVNLSQLETMPLDKLKEFLEMTYAKTGGNF